MFEQGFNSLLATSPGVMAQLGGSPFAREDRQTGVWPVQVPEEAALPNIAFSIVGRQSVNSVQGTSRLVMKRVQVNSRGRHYADAKNLQEAVKRCVLSFRGTLSDGTRVFGALLNSELDAFEDGPFLFCGVLDFDVWTINQS